MYINTFGISESLAHHLIFLAGVLDTFLALALFFKKLDFLTLWYAAIWGIVTAFARLTTGFYIDFPWESLHQVWFTVSYRLAHGLLPFAIIIYFNIQKESLFQNRKKIESQLS